jgi:hypothetical protein
MVLGSAAVRRDTLSIRASACRTGSGRSASIGQRLPLGYRGLLGRDALPYDVRSYYGGRLDPYSRYMYDNQYLYRVDPKTMIVSEVLRGLLSR